MKITENRAEPKAVQQPLQGITIELSRWEVEYIKKYGELANRNSPFYHHNVRNSSTAYDLIEAIQKVEL